MAKGKIAKVEKELRSYKAGKFHRGSSKMEPVTRKPSVPKRQGKRGY